MIVRKYTGDKLNFGLAVPKAAAEGPRIDFVFVDMISRYGSSAVSQRGLAGVFFVHKSLAPRLGFTV